MACCYCNHMFYMGILFSICLDSKRIIGKYLEVGCRDLSDNRWETE